MPTKTFPTLLGSVGAIPSQIGPVYYGAALKELGLEYNYLGIGTDSLAEFFSTANTLGFRGFGLTMPFKEQIIPMLDGLTDDAKKIGACNCALNEDGKWVGHNTDWKGALDALNEIGTTQPSGKALIVGSGGVARAIAYGLKQQGWPVYVTNRNPARAEMLVATQGLNATVSWQDVSNDSYSLIANCTPITAPCDFIDTSIFRNSDVFLDVVFNPMHTPLDEIAKNYNVKIAYGWRMLLFQAAHMFKLYTGYDAPINTMAKALSGKLSPI